MRVTVKIRDRIFWIVDMLLGGEVRKHYDDLKFSLENPENKICVQKQALSLQSMLKHANDTVPFYKSLAGGTVITDFPVINKAIIRENQQRFISDKYAGKKLYKITTSGSTGAPLSVWQDKGKRQRHKAENIYFLEIAGSPLGSRLYYLRVWNSINKHSWLNCRLKNLVMEDADNLSDDRIKTLIERLSKDNSLKSILAFSSTHEAISVFVKNLKDPLPVKVNSLITISEALPEGSRIALMKAFSCPVISRYSNMENGFLAQQCGDESGEYHLNTASYFLELLHPEKDEPVKTGEVGRIVVTDLFNYAMPIIRYDTGDMAIMSEKSACGRSGPVFTSVEGRRVDFIYDTQGHLLSPHVITNTMWKYSSEVKQFQFIQNGKKDFIIKLNTGQKVFTRSSDLSNDLKSYLGSEAKISIEYVDEIPLLASGKRKKIVNHFIN